MSIKAVLFDLDGTLLPMDQDFFIKTYFGKLVAKLAGYGYDPKKVVDAIWAGTGAMIKNNSGRYNEEAFWESFEHFFGKDARKDEPIFEEFYANEFDSIQEVCGYNSQAKEVVDYIKGKGLRVILATNPLFPAIATKKRMGWAGFVPEEFELYTTYENSKYCKPNLAYYQEILEKIGVNAQECLMVGNDVDDDMIVTEMGMQVFLLTDCLINKRDVDIENYPYGGFEKLKEFIDTLAELQ